MMRTRSSAMKNSENDADEYKPPSKEEGNTKTSKQVSSQVFFNAKMYEASNRFTNFTNVKTNYLKIKRIVRS